MISVTILTYNNEETLRGCLEAVKSFPEIIILDTGSTDKTLLIASEYPNVKQFSTPFIGFGPLHNLASSYATHDWILSIDADEQVTPELIQEIQSLALDHGSVYAISFRNYFQGKWIAGCGWHPDYKNRLYHRAHTKWTEHQVHESIMAKRVIRLNHVAIHYSYRKVGDFLHKMQIYSELFAKESKKKSSLWKAIGKSWAAFFRSYVVKGGWRLGKQGYIISRYQADVAYYKYLKLDEKNLSLHM